MEHSDAPSGKVQPLRPSDAEREQRLFSALREAESPEAFYGAWLGLQCAAVPGVRAGLVLAALRPGGGLSPIASHPEAHRRRRHLVTAGERVIREARALALQVRPEGAAGDADACTVIARPVEHEGRIMAVVALEVEPRPAAELERALRQLAWGSAWLQLYELGATEGGAGRGRQLEQLLSLVAGAFEHDHFRGSASAFVTDLATQLQCDRVSLGFLAKGSSKLSTVSHSSDFDARANLSRAVEAAMDEALDQESPVLWPPAPDAPPRVTRALEELARQAGSKSLAVFPLHQADRFVGALTLERADPRPFSESDCELIEASLAFAGVHLEVLRREERWLGAKALEVARARIDHLLGPGHVALKLALLGLAGVLGFLLLAKGDFRVAADSVLEARVLRAAAAPFDGYVAASDVRAGDLVRSGDLLALLDDRDLVLERARSESQLQQLRKQHRQALAELDAAEAEILSAQVAQVSAQLELAIDRLGRTRIVAPFDGMVVSGDLSQHLDAPVSRGDLLFEVAPLDAYRVVLMVEEQDVDEIRPGQDGSLVLFAEPGRALPIVVEAITPVSEPGEGSNRFRVEARLVDAGGDTLRPGMEGVAKIGIDRRRLLWIWTHEALDWLRLSLWQWLP